MEAYTSFLKWYRTTLATVCSVGSVFITDYLEGNLGQFPSLILTLILVVIVFGLFEKLMENLVENSVWLRKKTWGKQFIEGIWVDAVWENSSRDIAFGGIIVIGFDKGELTYSGTAYQPDGYQFGAFEKSACTYRDYILYVSHSGTTTEFPGSRIVGYGEFLFDRSGEIPLSFSGFYFESNSSTILNSRAKKIIDKNTLERILNPDEKSKLVVENIRAQTRLQKSFQTNESGQ